MISLNSIALALLSSMFFACSTEEQKEQLNLDDFELTDRPTKRSEVLAVTEEESGRIMIFAGNEGPIVNQIPRASYLEDTWIFEPGVGWSEIITDEHPSSRGRYAASLDAGGQRALVFGGRWRETGQSGDYQLFNDLWAFDFVSQTWSLLDDGNGTAPAGRYYPASAWDEESKTFYIFGGATNSNPMSINPSREVWSWTDDDGWTELGTSGEPPSRRMFFGNSHDTKRNRLLVMAGQIGDFASLAYNDFFALDLDTLEWTELHDGSGTAPSTRMHPMLNYDPIRDRYLAFGGHTDLGDANDMWSFDPNSGNWELLYEGDVFDNTSLGCLNNSTQVPADYVTQDLSAPERRHRGMHAVLHDNIWIFGGMHSECSDHLDDTWRYSMEDNTWHEVIEARTGESCLRRDEDCSCLCL